MSIGTVILELEHDVANHDVTVGGREVQSDRRVW